MKDTVNIKSAYLQSNIIPVNDRTSFCRIAIVYLAIGKYDILWDEFYSSCEQYLFPDAEKHYFVFTDSEQKKYLQPIITQYFIDNKSEIWLLFLIAHSKR